MFRLGLRKLLEEDSDLRVLDEAGDGQELLEKLHSHGTNCRLVITDLSMPRMSGLTAIESIHLRFPATRVLVLSMHKERDYIRKIMALGVDGYILKDDVFDKLVAAVKKILNGEKSFSDKLVNSLIEDYNTIRETDAPLEILTRREKEVLKLIAEGHMNKDIAGRLKISVRTVEAHRANLMDKLNIHNVQGLVKFALANGLI